jgi:Tol biopolymer transport system component
MAFTPVVPPPGVCVHSLPVPMSIDLYLMDADGYNVRRIAQAAPNQEPQMAGWSPDGQWIVYAGVHPEYGIWLVSADGRQRLQVIDGEARQPAWSSDGTRIVFVRQGEDSPASEIWVVDGDGTNLRQVTRGAGFADSPSWSPDGTRALFAADRDGNLDIYDIAASGEDQRRLTNTPERDYWPVWLPDGSGIAYMAGAATLSGTIMLMDPDGSNPRPLPGLSDLPWTPNWSPDGASVAYSLEGEIWVADDDGSNRRNLTQHPAFDVAPQWSPDGSTILFASRRSSEPIVVHHGLGQASRRDCMADSAGRAATSAPSHPAT